MCGPSSAPPAPQLLLGTGTHTGGAGPEEVPALFPREGDVSKGFVITKKGLGGAYRVL